VFLLFDCGCVFSKERVDSIVDLSVSDDDTHTGLSVKLLKIEHVVFA